MEYLKRAVMCAGDISKSHRLVAWLRLEGTPGDRLGQAPCSSRVSKSRLTRTTSSQVLSIFKDRHSTTFLGNLFRCSATLTVKKYFSLCSFLLVMSLGTTEKTLALSSLLSLNIRFLNILMRSPMSSWACKHEPSSSCLKKASTTYF